MNKVPLSKVDLNLLVVLDVLLREKSVSRTADKLHLTSSAVSHALKRLRLLFDNELLVRDGRQMVPTSRGESLAVMLPSLLSQVEETLTEPEPFDPANSTRSFRLAAPDFISPLMPHLLKVVSNEAPGISVEVAAFSPAAGIDKQPGRYDLLIAPSFKQTDDLRGVELGSWPWVTFGRKHHPGFANWSLDSWAKFPHLQVSASSPTGRNPIDRAGAQLGAARRIGAVVPQFSMAAPILSATNMLLTVPTVAMQELAEVYDLEHRDLPFTAPELQLSLFHDAKRGDAPEIRWFRARVRDAARVLINRK